jgi:uncharacterized protein
MKTAPDRDRFIYDMVNSLVELRIRGVSLEDDEPCVVLQDRQTDRRLQVPVGPFEASAIILDLESIPTPRPLTHALLADFFAEGGFLLDKVELFGEAGLGARARLCYRKGLRAFQKEVRPSDALALALRLEAPIFADTEIIDRQEREAGPWRKSKILALEDWKAKAMRA